MSFSGAGLGGLLLALFLQKECPELQVTIYESAHQLAEIGAGVAAWPRVWEVLKYLGLEEDLIQAGGTHDGGGMCEIEVPTLLRSRCGHVETFMRYRKGDEQEARVIGELKHKRKYFIVFNGLYQLICHENSAHLSPGAASAGSL